jgi:hypothetical protein
MPRTAAELHNDLDKRVFTVHVTAQNAPEDDSWLRLVGEE